MINTHQQLKNAEDAIIQLEKPFRDIMFGKNRENFRKNNKWIIKKISEEVNLSPQTVRKWIKRIENS